MLSFVTGALVAMGASSAACSDIELAYLIGVSSDAGSGVILRSDGTAWRVSKSVGCVAFDTADGRRVLIESRGSFLRPYESWLIIPGTGQRCRVEASEPLGPTVDVGDVEDYVSERLEDDERYAIAQAALQGLGFYSGEVAGIDDTFTDSLRLFQRSVGLDESGKLDIPTVILISRDVQSVYRGDSGFMSLALTLRADAVAGMLRRPGCQRLRVHSLSPETRRLGLSNGTIALLIDGDTFVARVKTGTDVVTCAGTMVSVATGDIVAFSLAKPD